MLLGVVCGEEKIGAIEFGYYKHSPSTEISVRDVACREQSLH